MTDRRPFEEPDSDEDVSRLLRLAGPRPDPPVEVAARVRAYALAAWRGELRARRHRRWLLALPAGLAAIVAIVLWRPSGPPGPTPTGPATPVLVLERVTGGGMVAPPLRTGQGLPIGSWLETAENGRAAWRMRGASVRQDRGTLVRLLGPAALWLERGALYVDGAGGAAAIEIRTAQGRILEVGTQFEVRASTPRLSVRVREGSVVLLRGQERHEVAAGRGLEADARTVAQRAVASHGPGWSWVEELAPEFPLEGGTLRSFLAWTARETGWRIRFARSGDAERAASITLHGSGAGLAPRDALATVLPSCGFVWRREEGTVWIEPAGEAR